MSTTIITNIGNLWSVLEKNGMATPWTNVVEVTKGYCGSDRPVSREETLHFIQEVFNELTAESSKDDMNIIMLRALTMPPEMYNLLFEVLSFLKKAPVVVLDERGDTVMTWGSEHTAAAIRFICSENSYHYIK